MKKILISFLAITACALAALAQTPQEILDRMEAELNKHDDSEGVVMLVDIKIPILGTMTSKCYTLGDKTRIEAKAMGQQIISWSDGTTSWTYNSVDNSVTIEKEKPSDSSEGDMDMFENITDGYDVTLKKQDAKAWYLTCKKKKGNSDKDAPKSLDLTIRKSDYFPISLTTTVSGTKMTMREIAFGVTEKQVTFNINDYPGAKVEDKR